MRNLHQRGFTLAEVVIVIAIIIILIAVSLPSFSKIKENQVLANAVENVLSSLNRARSQTLSSLNSSSYGVHFQSDRVVIFVGTSYSSGEASNEINLLTPPAEISNVTLNGVSSASGDVYFNRLSGVPDKTGTIIVSTTNFSKTITISATGSASKN